MREVVETECTRFGVPGAAVAVVAAGEVVLAEGFGRRNDCDPVTPRTLFWLASDTKCFTAATLCLLVEDGLLDLDRPVRDYLPWFAMHDERVSGLVTSRDLLTHRTGLPRHELVTIGNGSFAVTNEDVARRMRHLEASRPFRQGFGYNNAHYATAGHVAEVLTGTPWKQVLAERVLQPLGMTGTSTYTPSLARGDAAAPHVGGVQIPFQTREYDLPSGGVVSHAEDMARWLLARLGHGALSPAVLDLLHTPSVASGQSLPFPELEEQGYALGTMAVTYRGLRLLLHGGSQIGFASQVIVLPQVQVGVSVQTNAYGSSLPLALGLTLVDRLLDLEPVDWGGRLATPPIQAPSAPVPTSRPTRQLSEYAGTFHHPAYGDLSLAVREDELEVSFHGLEGELLLTHVADDDWLMTFLTLPGVSFPVCFRAHSDGRLGHVELGIEPELSPVVFQRL
jgi:CubicO group peptidase (beta-lactamase class C family)